LMENQYDLSLSEEPLFRPSKRLDVHYQTSS
jgi:hypothetical protein